MNSKRSSEGKKLAQPVIRRVRDNELGDVLFASSGRAQMLAWFARRVDA
jgi:hypothetical protein